jgi:hypothetical protein
VVVDSRWLENTLLPAALAAGVMLLVLWPTRHSGTRLLKNWGIPVPTDPQVVEAVRYLRQRRFLYVALFLLVPPVARLAWPPVDNNETPGDLFVPLLAAMLIAELVATLRPVSGVRVASLDRRTWRDLLPRWAVVATAVLATLALALVALGLSAQPWANRFLAALPPVDAEVPPGDPGVFVEPDVRTDLAAPTGWFVLGSIVLCLLVVGTLVHLAVRRPSVADPAVDAALRTRTARVAVAIGFGWLAATFNGGQERIWELASGLDANGLPAPPGWLTHDFVRVMEFVGMGTLVAAIVCWMWLALPSRRSLTRSTVPAG